MGFRRGFKSQCERRAVEFRKQLGRSATAALPYQALASNLNVVVWSTLEVKGLSVETLAVLNNDTDDSWSAVTLRMGVSNLVIYKSVNSQRRINSVVMHELAHIILGHELATACVFEDGSLVPGNFSQDEEDEADWFAGALLLPRPALMAIRTQDQSEAQACDDFMVSKEMLRWRMRMTGVDHQLARSRLK